MKTQFRTRTQDAAISSLVGVGLIVLLDVATTAFACARLPLWLYLAGGAAGAAAGLLLGRWVPRKGLAGGLVTIGLWLFGVVAAVAFAGLAASSPSNQILGLFPPSWDAKCSWTYCGRVLGPGLGVSPFPVGETSCSALSRCANEYPFTPSQYDDLIAIMASQGCPVP